MMLYHRPVIPADTAHSLQQEADLTPVAPEAGAAHSRPHTVIDELTRLDEAVYRAIEQTSTPIIDMPLRRVAAVADYSALWLGISAVLFVLGGHSGRRAALTGMAAVGLNAAIVNIFIKRAARRKRPVRASDDDTSARHLRMPTSRSFPSTHAASALAFATAVSESKPELGWALRTLAAVVAYARVHCGVHYPGDALAGALVGITVGEGTALLIDALVGHFAPRRVFLLSRLGRWL